MHIPSNEIRNSTSDTHEMGKIITVPSRAMTENYIKVPNINAIELARKEKRKKTLIIKECRNNIELQPEGQSRCKTDRLKHHCFLIMSQCWPTALVYSGIKTELVTIDRDPSLC